MRRLLALLLLLLASCSRTHDAAISVRLVYPQDGAGPSGPAASPAYPKSPSNRILIRVLGPHFAPIEVWFDRSAGHGEIGGIPPGERIAVEVDEYDNTAVALPTTAPLLGRGWTFGVTLAAGQRKIVVVPMYGKGTIVRVAGAAPSVPGGTGTAGDAGDGGLADNALLSGPLAVEVGPGDAVYVTSATAADYRIRAIDRYGYIAHYAGKGTAGTLSDGQPAADAPIGPVYDLEAGPQGDLYLVTWDEQVARIDAATGRLAIRYNGRAGNFNPLAKPDMAVVDDNAIYYSNGVENRIFLVSGGGRSEYAGSAPGVDTGNGVSKDVYPLAYPASVTTDPSGLALFFCNRDEHKIKYIARSDGKVYTKIGTASPVAFTDNMAPLSMYPLYPVISEFDRKFDNFFIREQDFHGIRVLRPTNRVFNFAGTGTAGYSGDGGAATAAQLRNPSAVAVDSRGNVYIADTGNHALRVVIGGALP